MNTQQVENNNLSVRSERLEARIDRELKKRIQYAADLRGNSLSEFLISTAHEAANKIIEEYKILKLTAEDSLAFTKAIFKPPKPNKRLKTSFLRYKKSVSSQP